MKFETGKIFKHNKSNNFYEVYKNDGLTVSFIVYIEENGKPKFNPWSLLLESISSQFCKKLYEWKPERERLRKTVNSQLYINYADGEIRLRDVIADIIAELNTSGDFHLSAEEAFDQIKYDRENFADCESAYPRVAKVKVTAEIEQMFEDEINEKN